jgi:hypothetical protein
MCGTISYTTLAEHNEEVRQHEAGGRCSIRKRLPEERRSWGARNWFRRQHCQADRIQADAAFGLHSTASPESVGNFLSAKYRHSRCLMPPADPVHGGVLYAHTRQSIRSAPTSIPIGKVSMRGLILPLMKSLNAFTKHTPNSKHWNNCMEPWQNSVCSVQPLGQFRFLFWDS